MEIVTVLLALLIAVVVRWVPRTRCNVHRFD